MLKGVDKAKRALELRLKGLTFLEIGRRLGVSRQRAQQLIGRYKLRRAFRLVDEAGRPRSRKITVEVPP